MERCYSYIRHCYAGDCKVCSLFVESVCDGKVCLLYYRIMKKLPIRTETSTTSNSYFIFSFRIIHRRKGLQQHPSYRTGTVRARTRIAIDGNRIKPKLQAIQSFVLRVNGLKFQRLTNLAFLGLLPEHCMSFRFFNFRPTTPSTVVGQEMEASFYGCSKNNQLFP